MGRNIFKLVFRFAIIAFVIVGICITPQNRAGEQFWFFTIQTNLFAAIVEFILCVVQILNMCGIDTPFVKSKVFSFFRIITAFFITITGLIYCFVLAPAGMIYNHTPFFEMFSFRNVLLHVVVPAMSIVDYMLYCTKGGLKYKHTPLFLIYPLIYFVMVNLRVVFGGAPFVSGSYYPYFFLDPNLEGQGWGMIAIYLIAICLLFYGLATLYIFIDKKLAKKKQHHD